MKANMMWAYLMHLNTNGSGEKGANVPLAPWRDYVTADDNVWRQTIDFLPSCGVNTVVIDLGDAIEYETHPEISLPGAWSKDKVKKELDYIRSLGMTPIPMLNFSAAHDAWLKVYSRMVSTPQYYQVCEDLILEVAELFGYPELFHLGMDEEWDQGSENMKIVRPRRIWWHDMNFFFGVCDKAGVRPWVWADPCWNTPEDYLANMSKSALQSNWWYGTIRKNPDGSYQRKEIETYVKLEEAGFEQVPTSSAFGSRWFNAKQNMEMAKESIAPERLKGFLTCSWYRTEDRHKYALLNEAYLFGEAKRTCYPEECK